MLRDVVFAAWRAAGCESYADTLGLLGAVDAFLPYMPLERPQLPALMALGLANRAELLAARAPRAALNWDADVPGWLAARVRQAIDTTRAHTLCQRHDKKKLCAQPDEE